MLLKVLDWQRRWDSGAVAATRPFLGHDGDVQDVVTQRAVRVAWRPAELDHLVRILTALKPGWELTSSMAEFRTKTFPHGRLLTGNRREAVMATYKKDIEEILEVLVVAHNGGSGKTVQEEVSSGSFWDKT
jgi:hypothetical protein